MKKISPLLPDYSRLKLVKAIHDSSEHHRMMSLKGKYESHMMIDGESG